MSIRPLLFRKFYDYLKKKLMVMHLLGHHPVFLLDVLASVMPLAV